MTEYGRLKLGYNMGWVQIQMKALYIPVPIFWGVTLKNDFLGIIIPDLDYLMINAPVQFISAITGNGKMHIAKAMSCNSI